jgi:hypothetical protein
MKKRIASILFSVALASAGAALALAAVTEPQTPVQTAPTLQATPQATKPFKLTPEQEAALVEVRKILKEAWEVATRIVPPTKPPGSTTPEASRTDLERYKERLLHDIELARFRAGDFTTAQTTKQHWDLAVAQIRYGHFPKAVQTATQQRFSFALETLVIMKMLSDAGDLAGALEVAQAQSGKKPLDVEQRQAQAELLAYLARRQAEVGKPEARATLDRAIEAVKANNKYPAFQYAGWTAIGCAQAAMGEQAASAESFRQAVKAALAFRPKHHKAQRSHVLRLVGRAARESNQKSISEQIFHEAIRAANRLTDPQIRASVVGMVAETQILSGDRTGGMQTFQSILDFTEELPSGLERQRALAKILERQLAAGERELAAATLERMRQQAETITDPKQRASNLSGVKWWESQFVTPQMALEHAYALQGDDEKQAEALAFAVYRLVHGKESVLTPDVLHRISQTALALLAKPLPDDRKRADQYLFALARVQAVATGASSALQVANRMTDHKNQKEMYLGLVFLLTDKKDFDGAKQMLAMLNVKDEEMPWGSSGMTRGDAFRESAKAQAATDSSGALAWAQQLKSLYAQVETLLGTAHGIMDRERIPGIRNGLPYIGPVGTGSDDTLVFGCKAL